MNFPDPKLLLLAAIPISFSFLPGIKSDTMAAPGLQANKIVLFRAIPFEAKPGDILTLNGSGFSRTLNKVYFNDSPSVRVASTDGTTLKVNVPKTLPPGEYKLRVVNIFGSSENLAMPIMIKVTNFPLPPPVISAASVSGDTVTLTGYGFESVNHIYTTMGDSLALIVLGNTLSFRMSDLSMYSQVKSSLSVEDSGPFNVTLWVYIGGEHGLNTAPYKVEIQL